MNKLPDSSLKYTLVNIPTKENYTPISDIYEQVTLSDIFQEINTDYLILCVSNELLTSVFNIYTESDYNFRYLIPWLKINYDDSSLINVTTKLKYCMDYVLVFQKPLTRNIKSVLQTLIIEPESPFGINGWQKKTVKAFSKINFDGVVVTQDGEVITSNEFLTTSQGTHKANLFGE